MMPILQRRKSRLGLFLVCIWEAIFSLLYFSVTGETPGVYQEKIRISPICLRFSTCLSEISHVSKLMCPFNNTCRFFKKWEVCSLGFLKRDFFSLTYIFYRSIIDLQCFRCTAGWFNYTYTQTTHMCICITEYVYVYYFSDYFLL